MSDLHSNSEARPAVSTAAALLGPGGVRALKIAIVVMGVLIVLGLLVVIGRVIQLSLNRSARPAQVPAGAAMLRAEARLALPGGAVIKTMTLSGDRLAVHYETLDGRKGGIVILDAASGETLTRVEIVPAIP
jgi:hypothetical protein